MGRVFLGEPRSAVYDAETGEVAAYFNNAGELDEDDLFDRGRKRIASRLEKRCQEGIAQYLYVFDSISGEAPNGAVVTVRGDGYVGRKTIVAGEDLIFYLRPGTYTYEVRWAEFEAEPGSFTVEEDGSTEYVEIIIPVTEE